MKSQRNVALGMFCLLVALGTGSRLLVEICPGVPPNFQAVVACTLFAGFYFQSRAAALAVPLTSMLLADQVIGGYDAGVMLAVYGSLLAPVLWRGVLRERLTAPRVALGAVSSSVVFFLVSNFAVWACGWYPATAAGFSRCFVSALPFFGYELCGNLLFATALFGAYALARMPVASRSPLLAVGR